MSVEFILTKDHSHTLYVPELDETYHSTNGALEEAMHVYIQRGLLDFFTTHSQKFAVSILEIGLGTGLNAWLTALACASQQRSCEYHALETFPLPIDIISQLNYTQQATEPDKQLFEQLHALEWNKQSKLTPHFSLTKLLLPLQQFVANTQYDIIYFDAFGPDKQPELWTEELFQKLIQSLNPDGIIITYASKGEVKRIWRKLGLTVERLPGPPGKRHMLRGVKV
jgi:tRNA U34 5-methylaminomethyl-2-thiouridine-forming methyltransferase MnmC